VEVHEVVQPNTAATSASPGSSMPPLYVRASPARVAAAETSVDRPPPPALSSTPVPLPLQPVALADDALQPTHEGGDNIAPSAAASDTTTSLAGSNEGSSVQSSGEGSGSGAGHGDGLTAMFTATISSVATQREVVARRLADAEAAQTRAIEECKAQIAACHEPSEVRPLLRYWEERHGRCDAELVAAKAASALVEEQARVLASVAELTRAAERRRADAARVAEETARSALRDLDEMSALVLRKEEVDVGIAKEIEQDIEQESEQESEEAADVAS
jgi:hypothetical protein